MLVHWGELSEELPRLSRGTAPGVEPGEEKACGRWGAFQHLWGCFQEGEARFFAVVCGGRAQDSR